MVNKNVLSIFSLVVLPLITFTVIGQIKADNSTEQVTVIEPIDGGGAGSTTSTTSAPAVVLMTTSTAQPSTRSSNDTTTPTTTSSPDTSSSNGSRSAVALETSGTGNESNSSSAVEAQAGDSVVTTTTTSQPMQMSQETVEHLIKILSSEQSDPSEPLHSFCDYMKPICDSLDKITEKCTARISVQMKKFVNLSNGGKLGSCFLEHYFFDPITTGVTKHDLNAICLSKNMATNPRGHYKLFQHCAIKHWTSAIDKEIDKIQISRLEFLRSNQHHKDRTTDMLASDLEESKAINDIINKVLGLSPNHNNNISEKTTAKLGNTELKIVNINGQSNSNSSSNSTTKSANESDKVIVLVDNSKTKQSHTTQSPSTSTTTVTTVAKQHKANNNETNSTTKITKESNVTETLIKDNDSGDEKANTSTEAPNTMNKLEDNKKGIVTKTATTVVTNHNNNLTTTTLRPSHPTTASSNDRKNNVTIKIEPESLTTNAPKNATVQRISKVTTQIAINTTTTSKPHGSSSLSKSNESKQNDSDMKNKEKTSSNKTTTSSPSLNKITTTLSPSSNDKIDYKASLEKKLKEDRDRMLKLLKKNQDELDAITAMKSLQAQKQKMVAQHDHSDERVHQMEHNRQMAIDPVGHMKKHQQYENQKKQSG